MNLETLFTPGTHFLTEPIRVPSGAVLKGHGTRLIGGVRLTDFTVGADGVYECDLTPLGIRPNPLSSRGFGRNCDRSHSELFINGRPCCISQYPERGKFLKITGYLQARTDEWGNTTGSLEAGFLYEDDRPKQWAPSPDLWTHGYWAWDWANSCEHIETLDAQRGFVRCYPPYGNYQYTVGQRFYFFNIREEVRHPGDYCIDYAGNRIFFLPFEDGSTEEVLLSTACFPAFELDGASDAVIEGFELEAFCSDAVVCRNSENVLLTDLHIHNCGARGVLIENCRGTRLTGSHIHDLGDGGVSIIGGDRTTLTPADCGVEGCHLHDLSKWSRCYRPPIQLTGVGLYAKNNVIHDCPHIAIFYCGNDMTITGNEIYRAVMETGDAGAIYSGRNYTWRGNVVSYNIIHHLGSTVGIGTMGIYNDDCLSGTVMEGNLFYKVCRAVFLGGGRDFVVRGNVFVDCSPAIEADARGASHNRIWHRMVMTMLKPDFYHIGDGASGDRPPYSTRYPELAEIDRLYRTQPETMIPPGACIEDNIVCGKRGFEFADYSMVGEFKQKNNRFVQRAELEALLPPALYQKFLEIE